MIAVAERVRTVEAEDALGDPRAIITCVGLVLRRAWRM